MTQLETLLQWESKDIIAKAAQMVAELAKSESGRKQYGNPGILKILVEMLKTEEQDLHVLTQNCRALGNICYDNGNHLRCSVANNRVSLLFYMLSYSVLF